MTAHELAQSAEAGGYPPETLTDALKSLWLARAGRWHQAHDLCQEVDEPMGAWIHGHLHRVEGDLVNAGYWYDRAGKPQPEGQGGLGEEWLEMAEEMAEEMLAE